MLLPSLPISLVAVCSLRVVACCYDYSSIHSSNYSDYFANLGLGSGSGSDSGFGMCCLHTGLVVAAGFAG